MTWCTVSGAGVVLGRLWLARPGRQGSVALGHGTVAPAVVTAGVAVAVVVALAVAARSAGVLAAMVIGSVSVLLVAGLLRHRRIIRRHRAAESVRVGVDGVVVLVELALHGGVSLRRAFDDCLPWFDPPIGAVIGAVLERADRGASLAGEFELLADRLPALRGLAAVVGATERHGAPAAAGLRTLRDELRHDQRYRLERAARTVPVQLVFPLVLGVFPAFVLLAVVPLLAGASAGLGLSWR